MKKTVTIILTAVLAAFMAVTASCADGKWYGFAEIENAVITKGDAAENPMTDDRKQGRFRRKAGEPCEIRRGHK